jgi:hypothetical protein
MSMSMAVPWKPGADLVDHHPGVRQGVALALRPPASNTAPIEAACPTQSSRRRP